MYICYKTQQNLSRLLCYIAAVISASSGGYRELRTLFLKYTIFFFKLYCYILQLYLHIYISTIRICSYYNITEFLINFAVD